MPDDKVPVLTESFIPKELHDREYLKPWLKKEWSPDVATEVFKKLDGAQSLLGKKLGIPAADAPAEEVEKFYGALRPPKADDYEIPLGEKPDVEFVKAFKIAAHEAGASARTLKVMSEKLMPFFKSRAEAMKAESDKLEQEYVSFVKETLGSDWDKKQVRVQAAIKELVPEAAKKFFDKLNNNDMALVVTVIDSILSKYAKEDDLDPKNTNGNAGSTDKDALVSELRTLFAKKGWKDHTDPESPKIRKRVEEIMAHPLLK